MPSQFVATERNELCTLPRNVAARKQCWLWKGVDAMYRIGIVATISAALCLPTSSLAEFIVVSENGFGAGWENVQVADDSAGLTVQGKSSQSNYNVKFTATTQFLASLAQRVVAREVNDVDSDQVAISGPLTISLASSGLSFGGLSFNAFQRGALKGDGTFSIEVSGFEINGDPIATTFTLDDNGEPLALGNGSNSFTVLASNVQRISAVGISPDANSSYLDLRNVRIVNVVPEPSTYAYYILLMSIGSLIAWRLR
jgi:hypothetical protein